jgi:hypothetical protein
MLRLKSDAFHTPCPILSSSQLLGLKRAFAVSEVGEQSHELVATAYWVSGSAQEHALNGINTPCAATAPRSPEMCRAAERRCSRGALLHSVTVMMFEEFGKDVLCPMTFRTKVV